MNNLKQAAQQALEALQCSLPFHETVQRLGTHNKAITALKTALEQPEQEPVAYFDFQQLKFTWAKHMKIGPVPVSIKVEPLKLYTSPQRKPLTHEQRFDLLTEFEAYKHEWHAHAILIDMVEAAHGIGEKP